MITKDPNAFLFEFNVLCKGYDYTTGPQKLKLLPSTLKGVALRWFMGLRGRTINSWDDMKTSFLTRYWDFCKNRELKDEIFKMVAKDNETLEEYVERFHYNLQRSPHTTLPKEVLRAILIKGMKEECIETLNLMGKGDISQEYYDEIICLCIRHSRGSTCTRARSQDSMSMGYKPHGGRVTRMEIGNLLEYFKMNILGTLMMQLDILQAKQKKALAEQNLVIFLPTLLKEAQPMGVSIRHGSNMHHLYQGSHH